MNARAAAAIRRQVLRGIALNRQPGFHFPGNFLELAFEPRRSPRRCVSLEPGPHCVEPDGQTSIAAVAIAADLALAACVRAQLHAAARLATVSMHLQFTGAPRRGRLLAEGRFEGFLHGTGARQGLARALLASDGRTIAYGTGAFMTLSAPPGVALHPVVARRGRAAPPVSEDRLEPGESRILRRADAALARRGATTSFTDRFWGFEPKRCTGGARCAMPNGPHAGNRVGHTQGGILLGLAACTASAALPASWLLSALSASFIGPGEGRTLNAVATITHRGGQTAVVRTEIRTADGRPVLAAMTTHAQYDRIDAQTI